MEQPHSVANTRPQHKLRLWLPVPGGALVAFQVRVCLLLTESSQRICSSISHIRPCATPAIVSVWTSPNVLLGLTSPNFPAAKCGVPTSAAPVAAGWGGFRRVWCSWLMHRCGPDNCTQLHRRPKPDRTGITAQPRMQSSLGRQISWRRLEVAQLADCCLFASSTQLATCEQLKLVCILSARCIARSQAIADRVTSTETGHQQCHSI